MSDSNERFDERQENSITEEENNSTTETKRDRTTRRAGKNRNLPKEENAEKKKKKRKKLTRNQNRIINILLAGVLVVFAVVMVISIINKQVKLTEINQQINDQQDILAEKQSLYTQLEMKIDANLSTAIIEKYAQEKLGMNKATNSQKEFINLSQGDKAEVSVKEHTNIFTDIAEAFSNLW